MYVDIVDYWMDYSPALKKFPPKREIDIILDVLIMFALFLYIYSTQSSIFYFLSSFIFLKVLDYFWLLSSKYEFRPTGFDRIFVNAWLKYNLVESILTVALIALTAYLALSALYSLVLFIVFRIIVRIFASLEYKKIHLV